MIHGWQIETIVRKFEVEVQETDRIVDVRTISSLFDIRKL